MSYSSEQTKERILACAAQEFLANGFAGANLRTIATNAKATTGAVYNHFNGKDGLFEAIVGDFAATLLELYIKLHNDVASSYDFDSADDNEAMGKGTFAVLDYLYQHFELAKLLFCCAGGTKYENFVHQMVEVEEQSTIKAIEGSGFELNKVNRFFIHVIASSGLSNMLEAIHHDLSREEALEYIAKVQRFYYSGTKEILEQ